MQVEIEGKINILTFWSKTLECGVFTFTECQAPTKAILLLSFSAGQEIEGSQDKGRERSFIDYYHGQNSLSLGKLIEFITN